LQRNEQVYVTDAEKSEYAVAFILHSPQYGQMHEGIGEKIWGLTGKLKTNSLIRQPLIAFEYQSIKKINLIFYSEKIVI
jgi:hypothetical protein